MVATEAARPSFAGRLGRGLSFVSRAIHFARAVPSRLGFPRPPWPARARAAGSDARRTAVPGGWAGWPGHRPEHRNDRSSVLHSSARWSLELDRGSLLLALGFAPSVWSMILSRSSQVPPSPGHAPVRGCFQCTASASGWEGEGIFRAIALPYRHASPIGRSPSSAWG